MRRTLRAGRAARAPGLLTGLVAALALLATACAAEAPSGSPSAAEPAASSRVELDTPELRKVRRQAGLAPCRNGPGAPGKAVEGGLPSVELPCFGSGESVDLATLRGPMVVSLWASWCPPCRRELPIFQQLAERAGDRLTVLGVDYADQQTSNAGELLLTSGVTYPQLADPGGELSGASPLPRIPGLPFLALVDADGRIVHQEFREIEKVEELERLVAEHLGVDV